jgi:tRNA(fMet)-specific endonuclease VapC
LNKALLDTDTYSEILKAADPNVTRNATAYRQARGVLMLSAVTVMEVIRGFQKNQRILAIPETKYALVG